MKKKQVDAGKNDSMPMMSVSFEKAVEMNRAVAEAQDRIKPTEQCIACAWKHYSEALCLLNEFTYEDENRFLTCGELRLIVRHTYKEWKDIATLARECSLLVQEARYDEARERMKVLGDMVADAFYEANPEVKARVDALRK